MKLVHIIGTNSACVYCEAGSAMNCSTHPYHRLAVFTAVHEESTDLIQDHSGTVSEANGELTQCSRTS